jgi:membrane peptidoglycan carboxypeptidase
MSIPESSFTTCGGGPYGYGTWNVSNYDNSSHVANLYSGTRLSINTFFAQLEQRTGLCKPYELAKSMGVRLTNPTGPGAERVPTFTLGIPDTTPLEMAEAYATFAARGKHCDARPVTRLLDAAGNPIRKYPENCQQVMQESTADAVNDILKGVIAPGGFASAQALDQPAAGKTGTTQDGKAVWFIGHTPNMAAAAMIAGADEVGRPETLVGKTVGGAYISRASGSAFAAPIWGEAMKVVDDWLEYQDFVFPSSLPGAGQTTVPRPDPPSRPDRDNNGGGNGGGSNGGGGNGGGNGNGNGGDD